MKTLKTIKNIFFAAAAFSSILAFSCAVDPADDVPEYSEFTGFHYCRKLSEVPGVTVSSYTTAINKNSDKSFDSIMNGRTKIDRLTYEIRKSPSGEALQTIVLTDDDFYNELSSSTKKFFDIPNFGTYDIYVVLTKVEKPQGGKISIINDENSHISMVELDLDAAEARVSDKITSETAFNHLIFSNFKENKNAGFTYTAENADELGDGYKSYCVTVNSTGRTFKMNSFKTFNDMFTFDELNGDATFTISNFIK